MPPVLALFLTLGFIGFLFRRDFREKPNVTGNIWLPILWVFILASRPTSEWLRIFGLPFLGGTAAEEGSSFDALVFAALIAWGFYILNKRNISLAQVVRNNQWFAAFFLYCLIAIFWSDLPLVSAKRWLKILGHPIMVLVLFTEPDPEEALVRLMKRCSYVLFPVSILWIKYYPVLGRKGDEWGSMTNVGIAGGKNEMGAVCLIFGLFLFWHLLQTLQRAKDKTRRNEIILTAGLLMMMGYCLKKSHSSTSTLSFLLGVAVMVALGRRFINKRLVGVYTVFGLLAVIVAQFTFDIYGNIVDLTGHGSTIEGRGRLWEVLLQTDTNPLFGAGFEGYWLGDRVQKIWAMPEFWWHPTQAHNGYLETYINLGAVGFFILLGLILATFRKCKSELLRNSEWGRFTMSCLAAILAHNWTEAGFKGLSLIFFGFFLVAINYPQLSVGRGDSTDEVTDRGDRQEAELARSGAGEAELWQLQQGTVLS